MDAPGDRKPHAAGGQSTDEIGMIEPGLDNRRVASEARGSGRWQSDRATQDADSGSAPGSRGRAAFGGWAGSSQTNHDWRKCDRSRRSSNRSSISSAPPVWRPVMTWASTGFMALARPPVGAGKSHERCGFTGGQPCDSPSRSTPAAPTRAGYSALRERYG